MRKRIGLVMAWILAALLPAAAQLNPTPFMKSLINTQQNLGSLQTLIGAGNPSALYLNKTNGTGYGITHFDVLSSTNFVGNGALLTNLPGGATIPGITQYVDNANSLIVSNLVTGDRLVLTTNMQQSFFGADGSSRYGSNGWFFASRGFVGDGSQITNLTITSAMLNSNLWVNDLVDRANLSATNVGRSQLVSLQSLVRGNTTLRVMFEGAGLLGSSGTIGIGEQIYDNLRTHRVLSGFIGGVDSLSYYAFGGGATSIGGTSADTNWYGGSIYLQALGDYWETRGAAAGGTLAIDTFVMPYRTGPNQGHYAIYTNADGGPFVLTEFTDINANGTAGMLSVTCNFPAVRNTTIRVTNTTAISTNIFPLAYLAFNSTVTNGLIIGASVTSGGQDLAAWSAVLPKFRDPIYSNINSHITFAQWLGATPTLIDTYAQCVLTNVQPNATKLVYMRPYKGDTATEAVWGPVSQICFTNAMFRQYTYFDGSVITWPELKARGLIELPDDGVHANLNGFRVYGRVFWSWAKIY